MSFRERSTYEIKEDGNLHVDTDGYVGVVYVKRNWSRSPTTDRRF